MVAVLSAIRAESEVFMKEKSKVQKVRLQTVVSKNLASRIQKYADEVGVSVSSLCAVFIGEGVMKYDEAYEGLKNTFDTEDRNQARI